jgi:polygalacturonase
MVGRAIGGVAAGIFIAACCSSCALVDLSRKPVGRGGAGMYDVRAYGARGNGRSLDTVAVNRAIDAANADGGGTVMFPAGVYLCHSIHLKSNVALYIGQGATIMAAPPAMPGSSAPTYDLPEPNPFHAYQDFGHNHWHNSLIWGENLENVAILGPGMIDGSKGLVRTIGNDRKHPQVGAGMYVPSPATHPAATKRSTTSPSTGPSSRPSTKPSTTQSATRPSSKPASRPTTRGSATTSMLPTTMPLELGEEDHRADGLGNKAIALKLCKNVTLRDFTVRAGGHFALLATGVDNCTIDNLKIDTNRDGMDLDCCRNMHVSNCYVNSPADDGICPKSSYALGYARPCENMTIANCQVSGYEAGTFLNGTYRLHKNKDGTSTGGTGRIKCGTESNGGFKNLTISNCVFDHCRGLALESVDGALLEDVTIDNITMRHVVMSPIFLRLGARLRGPREGTVVGAIRRINISNVVVYDADPLYSSIIAGIPGYPIQDVKLSNIQIFTHGGAKPAWAATRPAENSRKYPDPEMFGETPSYGFFVRHVSGIEFNNVAIHFDRPETRPPFVLEDVHGAKFLNVNAQSPRGIAPMTLRQVTDVSAVDSAGIPDTSQPAVENGQLGPGRVPAQDPPTDAEQAPAAP